MFSWLVSTYEIERFSKMGASKLYVEMCVFLNMPPNELSVRIEYQVCDGNILCVEAIGVLNFNEIDKDGLARSDSGTKLSLKCLLHLFPGGRAP